MAFYEQCFKDNNAILYPVRRYLARLLDLALFAALCLFLFSDLWIFRFLPHWLSIYLFQTGVMVLYVFVEPLLLSVFGTTLGKWIFGLELKKEGGKVPYLLGLKRAYVLFKSGLGFNIPFYNLYLLNKRYRDSKVFKEMPWDFTADPSRGWSYRRKRKSKRQNSAEMALVFLLLVVCSGLSQFYLLTFRFPVHRSGHVTKAEYIENANHYVNRYAPVEMGYRLDDMGSWARQLALKPNEKSELYPYYLNELVPHEIEEEHGVIKKVTVSSITVIDFNRKIALYSFLMADEGLDAWLFFNGKLDEMLISIQPSTLIYKNYKIALTREKLVGYEIPVYVFSIEKM